MLQLLASGALSIPLRGYGRKIIDWLARIRLILLVISLLTFIDNICTLLTVTRFMLTLLLRNVRWLVSNLFMPALTTARMMRSWATHQFLLFSLISMVMTSLPRFFGLFDDFALVTTRVAIYIVLIFVTGLIVIDRCCHHWINAKTFMIIKTSHR